jgi:hypothetical protein
MHDLLCAEHWGTGVPCRSWCVDRLREAHAASDELAGYWRSIARRSYEVELRIRVERLAERDRKASLVAA